MENCKNNDSHNLLVVSWKITESARIARQFMCNKCLELMDYDAVVAMNKNKCQKED